MVSNDQMYETSHILVLIKILTRDEITSHVITIWLVQPLVSISENELNRHLRHLQPWNYTTSLFLVLRQLSRAFNTHIRVTDIVRRYACVSASKWVRERLLLFEPIHAVLARGRLNHSYTRPGVRRRRNCLTVGGRRGRRRRQNRESASTTSFITNLFHPVVEIVRYALPKRQVCPPRRAVKEEFLSRVADVCISSLVSIRAWSLIFLSKCQVKF